MKARWLLLTSLAACEPAPPPSVSPTALPIAAVEGGTAPAVTPATAPARPLTKLDLMDVVLEQQHSLRGGDPWDAALTRIRRTIGPESFVVGDVHYWISRYDAKGELISGHGSLQPKETGNGCHMLVLRRSNGGLAEATYEFAEEKRCVP
jgi:hypothetical protein